MSPIANFSQTLHNFGKSRAIASLSTALTSPWRRWDFKFHLFWKLLSHSFQSVSVTVWSSSSRLLTSRKISLAFLYIIGSVIYLPDSFWSSIYCTILLSMACCTPLWILIDILSFSAKNFMCAMREVTGKGGQNESFRVDFVYREIGFSSVDSLEDCRQWISFLIAIFRRFMRWFWPISVSVTRWQETITVYDMNRYMYRDANVLTIRK